MKNFFASFVVGLPLTFIVLSLLVGGVENAWMLLFVSVICTFGLGLSVWIPLCWVIGWLTLALVGLFLNIPDGKKKPTGKRPPFTQEQVALTRYIKQAESRGMSHDEISDRLLSAGWGWDAIEAAFNLLAIF